jgi:fibronectin-binding autotransporter adhesin
MRHLMSTTAIALALSISSVPAIAQTWDGETNDNWGTATNWDGDVVPAAGGAVVIDGAGGPNQPDIGNAGSFTVDTVNVSGGSLTVDGDLFATTGVTISGGTVTIGNNGTITGAIDAQGGTFDNSGVITGTLDVSGGTVTNGGDVTGTTTVSAGSLTLEAGTNLSGTVNVSGTGTLEVDSSDTVTAVILSGGTIDGNATLTTTTFNQSGGELAGTVSASGAKTLDGGIISGTLSGAGATTIQTGTTTVSGTITGNVTLASGTLRLDGADIQGTITTTGSVISYADSENEASAIILNSNTTQLEVLAGDSAEQSGVISEIGGSRPLEKIGAGTLNLSAVNTYTGATTVTGGTLNVTGSIASSVITVQTGASLGVDGGSLSDNVAAVTLNGTGNMTLTGPENIGSLTSGSATSTVTLGANTLTTGGNNTSTTFAGVMSGTGGLTKTGTGTFTLTNANTYTGATTVSAGQLTLSGSGSIDSSVLTINAGGSVASDGGAFGTSLAITNNGQPAAVAAPFGLMLTGDESVASMSGNGTTNLSAGSVLTLNSGASNISGVVSGAGGITVAGTSTTTLSAANTYTGATTLSGGTLNLNGGAAIDDTAAVVVDGGQLELNASETIGSLAGAGGTIDLNANTLTTGGNNASTDVASNIIGTGALIKNGTGTMGLTGANTYSGGTTVNAGTLQLFNSSALSDAGLLTVNSPAIVEVRDSETVGNISGNGSIVMNGGNLTAGDATATSTFSGVISEIGGSQQFIKQGTGNLILSGANTYTGTTTINAGTLTLQGGAAIADVGRVNLVAGTVDFDAAETIGSLEATAGIVNLDGTLTTGGNDETTTVAAVIQGAGGLTKVGTGEMTLTGLNTFTGLTTVTGGTLTTTGQLLGGLTNNATTNAEGTINGAITNTSVFNLTGALTGDGAFNNSGALNVIGAQTLTQTGGLTNTGSINMTDGAADDSLTVVGNLDASTGTLNLDLNLNAPAPTVDTLVVNGALTGTVNVNFTSLGAGTYDTPGTLVVIQATDNSGSVIGTVTGLPVNAFVNNQFIDMGNNYVIETSLNLGPVGGLVGSLTASQNLINAAVNRPTSAFVATPVGIDADTCAPGTYTRVTGGKSSAETSTSSPGSTTAQSSVDIVYGGIQFGVDYGCFNLKGEGGAVNFGFLGGLNAGNTSQDDIVSSGQNVISDNDFQSRYIGAYVTYSKEKFFADVQAVVDWTNVEVNSTIDGIPFVIDPDFDSRRFTLSGSMGYAFAFDDISVVPSVGVSYSRTSSDTLELDSAPGGSLVFEDIENLVGFASVSVAKTIILPNETSAIQPFVTATIYNDFADEAQINYVAPSSSVTPTFTQNLGAYGELSAGINYRNILNKENGPLRDVTASLRGDLSFSDRLLGGRLTANLRLQF